MLLYTCYLLKDGLCTSAKNKILKSKSNTYKQNQCNYKMIQNSAFNKFLVNIVVRTSFLVIIVVRNIVFSYCYY